MHTRLSAAPDAVRSTTQRAHQDRAAHFLDMARAALTARASVAPGDGAGVLPAADHGAALGTSSSPVRTAQEIGAELRANREERRRSHEKARREAEATLPPQDRPLSVREAYSASPRVVVRPVQEPRPEPVPEVPPLEELLDLEALRPKRGRGAGTEGPGRLARLFDQCARHVLKAKRYALTPSQIVFHNVQEFFAAELGVDVATVREWTRKLEALGYCDSRPHKSSMTLNGERVTATDGTLYAVRLQPGHRARLSYDDLNHQWRDLDTDRKTKRTSWAILEGVREAKEKARQEGQKKRRGSKPPIEQGGFLDQIKEWAVTPGTRKDPLGDDPRLFPPAEPRTVQDVVYALPLVLDAHPTKRAALVGMLGAALARQLRDQHSRRWYCRLIWDAYYASVEGRAGLQQLAAQLARLDADRREWGGLRNPAALLVARLRYPPAVQA